MTSVPRPATKNSLWPIFASALKYKIQSGQWTATGGLQNPLDFITDSGALPGITR
jgi:hypothetical protein